MHNSESVQSRGHVVQYDSATFGKGLQLSHRRRFENIEDTKKYKARQKRFPRQRQCDECDQLTCHFINHHKLRIFFPRAPRHLRCGRNADECNQRGQCDHDGGSQ